MGRPLQQSGQARNVTVPRLRNPWGQLLGLASGLLQPGWRLLRQALLPRLSVMPAREALQTPAPHLRPATGRGRAGLGAPQMTLPRSRGVHACAPRPHERRSICLVIAVVVTRIPTCDKMAQKLDTHTAPMATS